MSGQLDLDQLSKSFGGVAALDAVSLTVPAGAIVAMVGSNGAGKTTLLDLINGLSRPDAGSISFDGQPITGIAPHRLCLTGLGRSFRPAQPFAALSVEENLVAAALVRETLLPAAHDQAAAVMARFGLQAWARRPAASLDRAERGWLELARAVATRPRLLLLDEVLADQPPASLDRMIEALRTLNRQLRLTILMTEARLDAVSALTERVVVLDHGLVIAEGAPDAVAAEPAVIETGLGLLPP